MFAGGTKLCVEGVSACRMVCCLFQHAEPNPLWITCLSVDPPLLPWLRHGKALTLPTDSPVLYLPKSDQLHLRGHSLTASKLKVPKGIPKGTEEVSAPPKTGCRRVIESFESEGTLQGHLVQFTCNEQRHLQQILKPTKSLNHPRVEILKPRKTLDHPRV